MIANITYGKDIYGLLYYNESKIKTGEGRLLCDYNLADDTNSFSARYQSLKPYCDQRPDLKYTTTHISLSFHPKDKSLLSDALYTQIIDDYLNEFGYSEQPYIAYEHFDRKHPHLHLVLPKIKKDGTAITAQSDRYKGRAISRKLEEKYGITLVSKKDQVEELQEEIKKNQSEIELQKYQLSSAEVKRVVTNTVDYVKRNYHYSNLNGFRYLLNRYGVDLEHHKGTSLQGEDYEGVSYYLYDKEKQSRTTKALKGSRTYAGKGSLTNIKYSLGYHKKQIAKQKYYTRSKIESVFRKYERLTLDDFIAECKMKNLDVSVLYSQQNRPIGLRLFDEKGHYTANFSEIDRAYGWKQLQGRFATAHSEKKRHRYLIDRSIHTYIFSRLADFQSCESEVLRYIQDNQEEVIQVILDRNRKTFKEIELSPERLYEYIGERLNSTAFNQEKINDLSMKERLQLEEQLSNMHSLSQYIKPEYLPSLHSAYHLIDTGSILQHGVHTEIQIKSTLKYSKVESQKDIHFNYADRRLFDKFLKNMENTQGVYPFLVNYNKLQEIFKDDNGFLKNILCANEKKYIEHTLVNCKTSSNFDFLTSLYRRGLEIALDDEAQSLIVKYHNSPYSHKINDFPVLKTALSSLSAYEYDLLRNELEGLSKREIFIKNLEAQAHYYASKGDIGNYLKTSNYLLQQLGEQKENESHNLILSEENLIPLGEDVLKQTSFDLSFIEQIKERWKAHFRNSTLNKSEEIETTLQKEIGEKTEKSSSITNDKQVHLEETNDTLIIQSKLTNTNTEETGNKIEKKTKLKSKRKLL